MNENAPLYRVEHFIVIYSMQNVQKIKQVPQAIKAPFPNQAGKYFFLHMMACILQY